MKLILALFLTCLITSSLLSQNSYGHVPNKIEFLKLASKHKTDTIIFKNYKILKIKRNKTYTGFGYQHNISQKFSEIIYLINDSLTFKTYTFDTGKERTLTKPKNDLFLFSDSTLGIVTYNYNSPFHEGGNGGCVYIDIFINQVKNNLTVNTVINLYANCNNSFYIKDNKNFQTGISGFEKKPSYSDKYINGWDTTEFISEANLIIKDEQIVLKMKYNECKLDDKTSKCTYYLRNQTDAIFNLIRTEDEYKAKFSHLKPVK